jgi:hypothetical protein
MDYFSEPFVILVQLLAQLENTHGALQGHRHHYNSAGSH